MTSSSMPARRGRVLLITASARRRGAEIQASQLAAELAALGWCIDIAALHGGAGDVRLQVPALGARRLGPRTLLGLRRRARSFDVVIAYGSATLPACAIALIGTGVPFIYRSISDPEHWLRGRFHRWRTRLQYRRAVAIVALWPGAADRLVHQLGVDSDRVSVIPNARNPGEFRPASPEQRAAARRQYGLGDEPVVAFIGAASPEKRLDLAIDTIAALSDHVLLVAGGGAGLSEARRHAREALGDRVVFLGEVADVRSVLHACDAVLITSDVEGMPGVAIEAALCGVEVVATEVGALGSMPGVRCAPGDVDSLAAVIATAAAPNGVRPRGIEMYTWSVVSALWSALLDDVAEAGRSEPAAPDT